MSDLRSLLDDVGLLYGMCAPRTINDVWDAASAKARLDAAIHELCKTPAAAPAVSVHAKKKTAAHKKARNGKGS
jgi:hypothetical protein